MLRDYELKLTQDVPMVLDVKGDFYRVISAESYVELSFDDSVYIAREQGMGGTADYRSVRIRSPKTQVVKICLGEGVLYDDRGENVSKYPSCSPYLPDVVVPAGMYGAVFAPSKFRYSATLSLPIGSESVRVYCNGTHHDTGGTNTNIGFTTAPQGVWLHGGGSMSLQTQTAIYVYNPSASDVSVARLGLGCSPVTYVT